MKFCRRQDMYEDKNGTAAQSLSLPLSQVQYVLQLNFEQLNENIRLTSSSAVLWKKRQRVKMTLSRILLAAALTLACLVANSSAGENRNIGLKL